jgi:hypothetical protein
VCTGWEGLTAIVRRPPGSLLHTQWLDIPILERAGHDHLTWGAFSESFDGCLRAVSRHVSQCVEDGADPQGIGTEALVETLDVLVSPIGASEKHRRLLSAADLLIARRVRSGPGRTDQRGLEDRGKEATDRESDT